MGSRNMVSTNRTKRCQNRGKDNIAECTSSINLKWYKFCDVPVGRPLGYFHRPVMGLIANVFLVGCVNSPKSGWEVASVKYSLSCERAPMGANLGRALVQNVHWPTMESIVQNLAITL